MVSIVFSFDLLPLGLGMNPSVSMGAEYYVCGEAVASPCRVLQCSICWPLLRQYADRSEAI